MAALWHPGILGWSGIVLSHISNLALKASTVTPSRPLSSIGSKLKSFAPFTLKLASSAFLTEAEHFGLAEEEAQPVDRALGAV